MARKVLAVVLAPVAGILLGLIIFFTGFWISKLNDPIGEAIAFIGGFYVAPVIYAIFVQVLFRSWWFSVICAILGFLGMYTLGYFTIGTAH